MNHGQRRRAVVCIALAIELCITSVGQADHSKGKKDVKDWDELKVFIETCGTDQDAGFKAELTHNLPAGPLITSHLDGEVSSTTGPTPSASRLKARARVLSGRSVD